MTKLLVYKIRVMHNDPKNCLQCEQPLNGQWRLHDTCIRARIRAIAAANRKEGVL